MLGYKQQNRLTCQIHTSRYWEFRDQKKKSEKEEIFKITVCCSGVLTNYVVPVAYPRIMLFQWRTYELFCSSSVLTNYVVPVPYSRIMLFQWRTNELCCSSGVLTNYVVPVAYSRIMLFQWRTHEFWSGVVQLIQLRTERTGIWGRQPPSQGFCRQL